MLTAVAALAMAGCGGSTKTVTVSGSPSGQSSAATAGTEHPATTATAGTTATTATTPSPATQAPGRIVHLEAFQSPTGNIGCMLIGGVARCDIARRSWSPPPRPADCPREVDYGQGLLVGSSGPGHVVCAGDTARDPASAKLAYGTGSQVGPFQCVSRTAGMTCTNRSSGHGFFISVESYRLF